MAQCLVVSGPPCAGKSTLARRLAHRLAWPLLSKDAYKERVFDALGVGDRDWSRRVSRLAWALLLDEAERHLACAGRCVLEGNLREPEYRRLRALAPRPQYVEVRVQARADVLEARYRARAGAGIRHPGHVDLAALVDVAAEFAGAEPSAARLDGPFITWDTSEGFDDAGIDAALIRVGVTALARDPARR